MRKKELILLILLVSLLCLSSCGSVDKVDELNNNGFVFTEIETGLRFQVFMSYDSSSETIYVLGSKSADGMDTAIVSIDTTDFEVSEFEYIFSEGLGASSLYPDSNGGMWVFERDPYGEILILKRYNSNNELESQVDLTDHVTKFIHPRLNIEIYGFVIGGCLYDGSLVIQEQQTAFLLDKSGNQAIRWELPASEGSLAYDRLRVSGEDIFYFVSDSNNNSMQIFRLLLNGQVETLYQLDKYYLEAFVDLNGQIYLVGYENSTNLYKLSESGDAEFLFGWEFLTRTSFSGIIALSDNTYVVDISSDLYHVSEGGSLEKNSGGEDKSTDSDTKQNTLKLACFGENSYISQKVNEFNRDRDDYKIELVDYANHVDGVAKMNMDIISGRAPDIILWSKLLKMQLDPEVYASKGILWDMNTFLDNDANVKDLLFDNVLEALEGSSGALYELPLEFQMTVIAGSQSVVGTGAGWTPDQFFALLEEYPEATLPFGDAPWGTLLSIYVQNNYDTLIDWEQKKSFFDTPEFARIIEMLAYTNLQNEEARLESKLIDQGLQLLSYNTISDVSSIQKFKKLFEDEITFIGFPTSRGIGNAYDINQSLSVSAASEYSDVCWEFLSTLLDYDEQLNNCNFFPVNNEALNERLRNPSKYEEAGAAITYGDSYGDLWSVVFTDATPEESRQVRELIESCDRVRRDDQAVLKIIMQDLPSYFNGTKTAEEVVRIIQSRVETYLNEQG